MSVARFEDVNTRFFRELSEVDRPLVEARLADAEDKIRARIPDFDDKIANSPGFAGVVVRVCCDAVIRIIRNPEGYIQETDGNYTYMLAQSAADGRLVISPDEWRDLGVNSGFSVFHVIPKLAGEA